MKKFLTLILATTVLVIPTNAWADLPVAKADNAHHFAHLRIVVAHRIDDRHDQWLAEKRERRRKIRERRKARAAAAAAAAAEAAEAASTATTPTTSYAPSMAVSGSSYVSAATAADAMRSAGFPEDVIAIFVAPNGIIQRESNFCPTAVYPGHCGDVSLMIPDGAACSLFQLYTCPGPQVADPYVAARYAYAKYQDGGLSHWGG